MYIIGLLVGLVLIAFLWVGCTDSGRRSPAPTKPPEISTTAPRPADGTRKAVEQRLQLLARQPRPKKLSMGAMCYDMAVDLPRLELVCPDCGEKTLYPKGNWRAAQLAQCQRLVTQIPGIDIGLDPSQFCAECSPDVKEPAIALVVRYPGQDRPHRTTGVVPKDLELLKLLFEGRDRYRDEQERETALQDFLPRFHELLGVPPPAAGAPRDE